MTRSADALLALLALGFSLQLFGCGGSQARSADAAESGDGTASPAACGNLAKCIDDCEGGNAESCEWLGHMHETGDGAPQDYEQAAKYYDRACAGGRDEACAHLAMMYDIGLAVEEDPARAAELYNKACKAGNSWACNRERDLD